MKLRIRQERQDKDWTQQYVADHVGLKKTTVQQIETGQRRPSYEVLVRLEDLFKLPHRQLFAVVDDNSNQFNNTTNQKKCQ